MDSVRKSRSVNGNQAIGVVGLIGVALTLPGFIAIPPAPALGSAPSDIVAYYNQYELRFLVFGWLIGCGAAMMLTFAILVAGGLRTESRVPSWVCAVYLTTSAVMHAVQIVMLAVFQVIPHLQDDDLSIAAAMSDLGNVGFSFLAIATMFPVIAGAIALRFTCFAPSWISWFAWATAALCALGSWGAVGKPGLFLLAGMPLTSAWYGGFLILLTLVSLSLICRRPSELESAT